MPNAAEVIGTLNSVTNEVTQIVRAKCPHCAHKWTPSKTANPKWCPRCKRRLDTQYEDKLYEKKKQTPDLLEASRFTPANMKLLVSMRLYSYKGIPKNLPRLTMGRDRQRQANLMLTDRFFRSELSATDFGRSLKFSRQAFWHRLEKGFSVMLERGCFAVTQKGREKIAAAQAGLST